MAPTSYQFDELLVRAYRAGDGAALQVATVSSYEHLRTWMPWATPDQSVEAAEGLCCLFAQKYEAEEDFVLGVWRGGELIGGTGFHLRVGPRDWGNAEIGMWIRASAAQQGIGTRVLRALLDWGFGEWNWERLVWRCATKNLASARVAEKCGLRLEGTFLSDSVRPDGIRCDTHLYAVLRDEHVKRTGLT